MSDNLMEALKESENNGYCAVPVKNEKDEIIGYCGVCPNKPFDFIESMTKIINAKNTNVV